LALHGWRRELFGDKALALKRGLLSLAVQNGKVVAIEPEWGRPRLNPCCRARTARAAVSHADP
jgi:ribonuclease D